MRRLLVVLMLVLFVGGCTYVDQAQKNWVHDKANRHHAYIELMDAGKTTPDQDKAMLRSDDESWRLWSRKMDIGLAAPSWMIPATQPGGE